MERMDKERMGQIAWLTAKRDIAKSGVPIGGKRQRDAHNLASNFKLDVRQVLLFFQEMHEILQNENFPDMKHYTGFPMGEDYAQEYAHRGGRYKIAIAYLFATKIKDGYINLDKERMDKAIADIDTYINRGETAGTVSRSEIRLCFAELSILLINCLQKDKVGLDELLKG